jgi:hypothetical protein
VAGELVLHLDVLERQRDSYLDGPRSGDFEGSGRAMPFAGALALAQGVGELPGQALPLLFLLLLPFALPPVGLRRRVSGAVTGALVALGLGRFPAAAGGPGDGPAKEPFPSREPSPASLAESSRGSSPEPFASREPSPLEVGEFSWDHEAVVSPGGTFLRGYVRRFHSRGFFGEEPWQEQLSELWFRLPRFWQPPSPASGSATASALPPAPEPFLATLLPRPLRPLGHFLDLGFRWAWETAGAFPGGGAPWDPCLGLSASLGELSPLVLLPGAALGLGSLALGWAVLGELGALVALQATPSLGATAALPLAVSPGAAPNLRRAGGLRSLRLVQPWLIDGLSPLALTFSGHGFILPGRPAYGRLRAGSGLFRPGIRPSLRGLPPPAQPSAGEVLARLTFHPLCRRGVPDGRYLAMLEPLSPKHSFFGRRDISLAQRQRQSAVFDTYR